MPSPLSPPVGDELLLELHRSGRRAPPVRAQSRVIDARAFRRARPGHPAGFWLSIGDHAGAHALLADRCAGGAQYEARRASQRFPVRGRVLVRAVDGSGAGSEGFTEARLRNLSMGGLFVRGRPRASGERVEIETFLPTGVALRSKGTVAHVAADGFGVRFDQDADGAVELALAAMLAGLSGVSRRVLLVDDDPLALAMLEDAFRARGWEVATVADASEGLQLLTDSLFALDLLVTDVMMRDVDGEELVRRIREAGGEGDLPILAVTASPTLELCDRLRACGADEVASKGAGIERIVDAAEALVASRRAAEARPVGAGAEGRAA